MATVQSGRKPDGEIASGVSLVVSSSRHDDDARFGGGGGLDCDFDTLVECGKESEEAVEGVAIGSAAKEGRHFRLIQPQHGGRFGLSQFAFGDHAPELLHEFGLAIVCSCS